MHDLKPKQKRVIDHDGEPRQVPESQYDDLWAAALTPEQARDEGLYDFDDEDDA